VNYVTAGEENYLTDKSSTLVNYGTADRRQHAGMGGDHRRRLSGAFLSRENQQLAVATMNSSA
jgi:hypothetical protein